MRIRSARRLGALAMIAGTALAVPAAASGAGISLERVPAPPQAVSPGQAEQIDYTITYDSDPIRSLLQVTNPSGVEVLRDEQGIAGSGPGTFRRSSPFTPSTSSPSGRYQVSLQFFSNAAGDITPENTATTIFDVANDLGNLRLTKWEDTNGNGAREGGEPLLPNWRFNLTNPSGNASAATTGPDGSALLSNVPAGTWNVSEVLEPGWLPVTTTGGTVNVPVNGTGTFEIGNVRPAQLSGIVWVDQNRNQRQDVGEVGAVGIKLELSCTTGTGEPVSGTTFSGTGGAYSFTDLRPGVCQVRVVKPGAYELTTPQTISNIRLPSGGDSRNNNFGIVRGGPTTTTTGTPNPPDLSIDKRGPARRARNVPFNFVIRVTNTSRFVARNVVLIDPVPDSMVLVRRPTGARVVNGVLRWNLGTIRAGRSKTVRMRVRILPGVPAGPKRNSATVTATGVPPRSDTAIVRVTDPPPPPRSGGVTG